MNVQIPNYSKRLKSEHSDFGRSNNSLVVKRSDFSHCMKSKQFSSVFRHLVEKVWFGPNCLKSERSKTKPFQPKSYGPNDQILNVRKLNLLLFGFPNQTFGFRTFTVCLIPKIREFGTQDDLRIGLLHQTDRNCVQFIYIYVAQFGFGHLQFGNWTYVRHPNVWNLN